MRNIKYFKKMFKIRKKLLNRHSYINLLVGVIIGVFVTLLMSFAINNNVFFSQISNQWDGNIALHSTNDEAHVHENSSIAQKLEKEVRILCWVMTTPKNHKTKAIHVMKTWGKRCNKLIFMSSTFDPEINSVPLPVKETGHYDLYGKSRKAFMYVYENHLHEADWFLKADDDT